MLHNSIPVRRSLSAPFATDFTRKGIKLVRVEGKGREGGGVIIVAINLSFVLKQRAADLSEAEL